MVTIVLFKTLIMVEGILLAIGAGLVLGLYAVPGKFTKNFAYEHTWGLFLLLTMFLVPALTAIITIRNLSTIFTAVPGSILFQMAVAGFLWGIGVIMWSSAINRIGMSLGFSLFIGTTILIGSILPFLIDAVPSRSVFLTILCGIAIVLIGVLFNGKAGLIREKDEMRASVAHKKGVMTTGILIAVAGGLLASGFSYGNAVGRTAIHQACQRAGNPEWVTAIAVMLPIFISGGSITTVYFARQLYTKKLWYGFAAKNFFMNFWLILIMAVFHYAASVLFAFSAFKLGAIGNTVGYAIFNTACVLTATTSGLITREWSNASGKAKNFLYISLLCMVAGIVIIAMGNQKVSLNKVPSKPLIGIQK